MARKSQRKRRRNNRRTRKKRGGSCEAGEDSYKHFWKDKPAGWDPKLFKLVERMWCKIIHPSIAGKSQGTLPYFHVKVSPKKERRKEQKQKKS